MGIKWYYVPIHKEAARTDSESGRHEWKVSSRHDNSNNFLPGRDTVSGYTFGGYIPARPVLGVAGRARRLRAAERRVKVARARADRNPSSMNLEAASELEAGLNRLKAAS